MGSTAPRGDPRGDSNSTGRKFRAETIDDLCTQLSSWPATQFPLRGALSSIAALFQCQDVMVLTKLPSGELQPATLLSRDYALATIYRKELSNYDRASWRALTKGRATQCSRGDEKRVHFFWGGVDRFDIDHVASARLESPILPRYPGILMLMRERPHRAFSNEQLHQLMRVADALSGAMARSMQSRTPAKSSTDARPPLPAYVFAIKESLKALFPSHAWRELDEVLRQNLQTLARQTFQAPVLHDTAPVRIGIADSTGNLYNFHAVQHLNLPALHGKSIVCLCIQPPTGDWTRLRPDDFAADPEVSRLIPSLQYIAASFQRNPSLSDIAANVSLSPFHFHRCFTERLGLTPKHFLLDCQIERAKSLLVGRRFPLSHVASSCGFSHQSHFTSRFKQAVGHTPTKWRKRSTD